MRLLFLLLLYSTFLFSQDKVEKEYRIKTDEVPSSALSFMKKAGIEDNIKWYKEENTNSHSFEAKVKIKKRLYSIEFDSIGNIEDIEVLVKKFDPKTENEIQLALKDKYNKAKLIKRQIQYTGTSKDLINFLKGKEGKEAIVTIKYEIIISEKSSGNWFEVLINESFEIERSSKVIFKNHDNLMY